MHCSVHSLGVFKESLIRMARVAINFWPVPSRFQRAILNILLTGNESEYRHAISTSMCGCHCITAHCLCFVVLKPYTSPKETNSLYIMYHIAENFHQISPPGLVGESFVPQIFCPVLMIT